LAMPSAPTSDLTTRPPGDEGVRSA
jgi:hypothetical protein